MRSFQQQEVPLAAGEDLLTEIRITHVLDCLADPSKVRVIAAFDRPLPELLPYLATLLPQAGYSRDAGLLTLYKEGRLITVYPHVVTIAKAHDEPDALDVLCWLRLLLKEAAAGMASGTLAPCSGRVGRPRLLDIYLLLPRSNCRDCGERTCLAFAAPAPGGLCHAA